MGGEEGGREGGKEEGGGEERHPHTGIKPKSLHPNPFSQETSAKQNRWNDRRPLSSIPPHACTP